MIQGNGLSFRLPSLLGEFPQRTLGERIVQAARLAAALHLADSATQALEPAVSIGAIGPQIRRQTNSDRSLAA